MPPRRRATAQTAAPEPEDPLNDEDVAPDLHPFGIIILSHSPPKDIRFSVTKEYFKSFPTYDSLPDRVVGEIECWTSRATHKLKVQWLSDSSNSLEFLAALLNPKYKFKLELKGNGATVKAVGNSWRVKYATAVANGPYAHLYREQAGDGQASIWSIKYNEGAAELVQDWTHRPSQYVKEDQRGDGRFKKLKIKDGARGLQPGQHIFQGTLF